MSGRVKLHCQQAEDVIDQIFTYCDDHLSVEIF